MELRLMLLETVPRPRAAALEVVLLPLAPGILAVRDLEPLVELIAFRPPLVVRLLQQGVVVNRPDLGLDRFGDVARDREEPAERLTRLEDHLMVLAGEKPVHRERRGQPVGLDDPL